MKRLFLIFFVLGFRVLLAQSSFSFLNPGGENWPEDLNTDWLDRIGAKLEEDPDFLERSTESDTDSDFWIMKFTEYQHLLSNGNLLFGDSLSLYLNDLADRLLVDSPQLRSRIRVYAWQKPTTNAFSAGNGLVMIHTGLVAHLESEEELAMVILHEIAHDVLEHSYKRYKLSEETPSLEDITSGAAQDKLMSLFEWTREQEMEADLWAFKYAMKIGISKESAINALKSLFQARHPYFKTVPKYHPLWPTRSREMDSILPNYAYQNFSENYNYEFTSHTHPSIGHRIEKLSQYSEAQAESKTFTSNEAKFRKIRRICRLELIRGQIQKNEVHEALFNLAHFEEYYPRDPKLLKLRMRALHKLLVLINTDLLSFYLPELGEFEGPAGAFYKQIKALKKEDVLLLSLAQLYETDQFVDADYQKDMTLELLGLYFSGEFFNWTENLYELGPGIISDSEIKDTLNSLKAHLDLVFDESSFGYLINESDRSQIKLVLRNKADSISAYFRCTKRSRAFRVRSLDETMRIPQTQRQVLVQEQTKIYNFYDELELEGNFLFLSPRFYALNNNGKTLSQKVESALAEEGLIEGLANLEGDEVSSYNLFYRQYNDTNGIDYAEYVWMLERVNEIRNFHQMGFPALDASLTLSGKVKQNQVVIFSGYLTDLENYYVFEVFDLNRGILLKRKVKVMDYYTPTDLTRLAELIIDNLN